MAYDGTYPVTSRAYPAYHMAHESEPGNLLHLNCGVPPEISRVAAQFDAVLAIAFLIAWLLARGLERALVKKSA